MLDVMQCLQKALVREVTGSTAGVTCDSTKKNGYASHIPLYINSGLCELPPDRVEIVRIYGNSHFGQESLDRNFEGEYRRPGGVSVLEIPSLIFIDEKVSWT